MIIISIILIVCLLINIIYFILNIASLFNPRFIYYNDKISTCDVLKIINTSSCNNKEHSVKPTRKMIFARIVMTGWNIFFCTWVLWKYVPIFRSLLGTN